MSVEVEDVTGRDRPERDVLLAIACIEREMVTRPMAMSAGGEPLLLHYMVIRDALIELLRRRHETKP